ncbi:MAG: hypothetical protein JNL79_23400 [Myxococcales bacterium]|nr:hypothetical protein [Myxococcales bacterium]
MIEEKIESNEAVTMTAPRPAEMAAKKGAKKKAAKKGGAKKAAKKGGAKKRAKKAAPAAAAAKTEEE